MDLEQFLSELRAIDDDDGILDYCRKHVLHGTPFVYTGRESEFYEFRKLISLKYDISFHEIYITGSAKLGFSPYKEKVFDLDSDIDVALVSPVLFEKIMSQISEYQMSFRRARTVVRQSELDMYHQFLEYVAMGWIRPDKLPISFQMKAFKDDWFEFFRSISDGKSTVGNYKVSAGIFQSYGHLEKYIVSGLKELSSRSLVGKRT